MSQLFQVLQDSKPLVGPVLQRNTAVEGLYLHVPYCFHKCHYCDFYSLANHAETGPEQFNLFVDSMIQELEACVNQVEVRPRTIFAGGGTPTLLGSGPWARLLKAMRQMGLMGQVREFTVEANPETVDDELMQTLAAGGVNRISIGCQSFDERLLKALERWHDPVNVATAVRAAWRAGIDNINLDLIFAIPGQTLEQVEADLDQALELAPQHVSYYGLTYEPNTPLAVKLEQGQVQRIDEALECRMYERIVERLDAAGFEHYEISNWARTANDGQSASRRCEHHLMYWRNGHWRGIGPAAASHVAGRRWRNEPHLGRYLQSPAAPPVVDDEQLSPDRRIGEALMLGLRLREGVAIVWLDEHVAHGSARDVRIREFERQGLLERTATNARLTRRGLLVADAVIGELL